MSLKEEISVDLTTAMKARDSIKVTTLRMVRAQIKDTEIAKGNTLSEDEVLSVLNSAAKKRKEAIAIYEKSERPELLEKEQNEKQMEYDSLEE